MAFPNFQFAAGGDDSYSGAGPGDGVTAGNVLAASGATRTGANTISLVADTPDLSGVLTDGSHAIKFNGATYSIVGKDDGLKTVTTGEAVPVTVGAKAWAIGGKLLTLEGCRDLLETDFQESWDITVANDQTTNGVFTIPGGDHLFTFTGGTVTHTVDEPLFYITGSTGFPDIVTGLTAACTVIGEPVAAAAVQKDGGLLVLRDFHLTDFSYAMRAATADAGLFLVEDGVHIGGVSVLYADGQSARVDSVYATGTSSNAVTVNSISSNGQTLQVSNCRFIGCARGVQAAGTNTAFGRSWAPTVIIVGTVIANATGDAIELVGDYGSTDDVLQAALIENNFLTGAGGYALKVTGTGNTAAVLGLLLFTVRNNNTFGCVGGNTNISGLGSWLSFPPYYTEDYFSTAGAGLGYGEAPIGVLPEHLPQGNGFPIGP